jgi:hypothetical protein
MRLDTLIAFRAETEPPPLEIRVNFGVFAGRAATPAEIDELARALIPEVGEVSIVAEDRHEIGEDAEASLHQVRIEVADEHLPASGSMVDDLAERLVATADGWARACIADRNADVSEL